MPATIRASAEMVAICLEAKVVSGAAVGWSVLRALAKWYIRGVAVADSVLADYERGRRCGLQPLISAWEQRHDVMPYRESPTHWPVMGNAHKGMAPGRDPLRTWSKSQIRRSLKIRPAVAAVARLAERA